MSYLIEEVRNQGAMVIDLQKKNKVLEKQYVKCLNNYNDAKKWGDSREALMLEQNKKINDLITDKGLDVMAKTIIDLESNNERAKNEIDNLQKKLSEAIIDNLAQETRNKLAIEKLSQIGHYLEQIRQVSIAPAIR